MIEICVYPEYMYRLFAKYLLFLLIDDSDYIWIWAPEFVSQMTWFEEVTWLEEMTWLEDMTRLEEMTWLEEMAWFEELTWLRNDFSVSSKY